MKLAVAVLIVLISVPSVAQQHHHGHSPYAGFQERSIKALSEQQLSDLREGRGMGMALAAELNGYPGPIHVLELADALSLTEDQKQHVQQLFEAMKAEAIAAGTKSIEARDDAGSSICAANSDPRKVVGAHNRNRDCARRTARGASEISSSCG